MLNAELNINKSSVGVYGPLNSDKSHDLLLSIHMVICPRGITSQAIKMTTDKTIVLLRTTNGSFPFRIMGDSATDMSESFNRAVCWSLEIGRHDRRKL